MKTRAILGVLATMILALIPVTPARASAPDTEASLAASPGGEPVAIPLYRLDDQRSSTSRTSSDCAREVKASRSSSETEKTLCVGIEPDQTPEPLSSKQRRSIATLLPECEQTSTPNVGWWASSRREACAHHQFDLVATEVPSGAVVGTANLHATLEMSATGTTWTSTVYLWVWDSTGLGFPEYVSGHLFGCDGCTATSTFSEVTFDGWNGTGTFTKAGLPAGAIQANLDGSWELSIGSAQWSNIVTVNLDLAEYRCDNAINGHPAGCVFREVPGAVGFSLSRNPDFVQHVGEAHLSGLPGGIRSGTYLSRLMDKTLVDKNGATACPRSLARPTGYECDEYPFRSTYQGAYTGGSGQARSLPWCQVPDPERTGPTGWSPCFIPSSQNSSAGGLLSAFYWQERILDGDRFQVGFLA